MWPLLVAVLLCPTRAVPDDDVIRNVFSAATAAAWVTVLVGMSTLFAANFMLKKKCPAVLQAERVKGKTCLDLMTMVMNDVQAKCGDSKLSDMDAPNMEGLPEAQRLFGLLWDDVKEVRTTTYGISETHPAVNFVEDLLKVVIEKDFTRAMEETEEALSAQRAGKWADGSNETSHREALDGRRLQEILDFCGKVSKMLPHLHLDVQAFQLRCQDLQKRLAKSFAKTQFKNTFFLQVLHLSQATDIWVALRPRLKQLSQNKQSEKTGEWPDSKLEARHLKNLWKLLEFMVPIMPSLVLSIATSMVADSLAVIYHQVRRWAAVGEAAAAGERSQVLWLLVDLVLGHLAIEFFRMICKCYSARAQSTLLHRVRSGVMQAIVLQDFAYFDQNASGALQERLNRDAEQLGSNIIEVPEKALSAVVVIILTLFEVYLVCPLPLFAAACAPIPVIAALRWHLEKLVGRLNTRGRKLTEEAAAGTAEILKEIKTVRQFANERHESLRFSHAEAARGQIQEDSKVLEALAGLPITMVIVTGLSYTQYIGAGLVEEGMMTPGLLFDVSIKLNFWVVDRINRLTNLLPQLRQAFEPLARICDLLDSTPKIEAAGQRHSVPVADRAALMAILEKCSARAERDAEASEEDLPRRSPGSTVLTEDLDVLHDGRPIPRGSALLSFECGAWEHAISSPAALQGQEVSFPLTLHFSVQKVPAHFVGRIDFEDVHFRYPTDLRNGILNGFTMTVEPKTKVALVGEAGCGKSSCMALLQRFYDPTQGCIRIDGVDLREYNVNVLRSRVAVVDQRPVLFASSVRENVTYGLRHEVSDEEVIQVLQAASLWDGSNGIKSKADRLLTKLGSGGISLSGGQMQRVSIARVMIRKPDIILLDEATSALDNKNEKIVQAALDQLAHQGSALVIAHRLTTIKDADKIVVMRKGQVAEVGTHQELLKLPIQREKSTTGEEEVAHGIYRFLWELQFADETETADSATEVSAEVPSRRPSAETPILNTTTSSEAILEEARPASGRRELKTGKPLDTETSGGGARGSVPPPPTLRRIRTLP
ncbi:unnamed protein product [Durusdinium trenchii]|uniref:ABC transporter n=1 Tax=Durusdinium trenchii TaxID=1381693 RepID=A0ABP0SWP3_9DINO